MNYPPLISEVWSNLCYAFVMQEVKNLQWGGWACHAERPTESDIQHHWWELSPVMCLPSAGVFYTDVRDVMIATRYPGNMLPRLGILFARIQLFALAHTDLEVLADGSFPCQRVWQLHQLRCNRYLIHSPRHRHCMWVPFQWKKTSRHDTALASPSLPLLRPSAHSKSSQVNMDATDLINLHILGWLAPRNDRIFEFLWYDAM